MAYKGLIYIGTTAKVTMTAEATNLGPMSFLAGVGWEGGEQSEHHVLAPGSDATIELPCQHVGLLRVEVAFGESADGGLLAVERGTLKRHEQRVTGSTAWRYAVVEAPEAVEERSL